MKRVALFCIVAFFAAPVFSRSLEYYRMGTHPTGGTWAVGNVNGSGVWIVDVPRCSWIKVPDSTADRLWLYPGIAVAPDEIHVTYPVNNHDLMFTTYRQSAKVWSPPVILISDQGGGDDTNRSSIAVSPDGNRVMVVCQSDAVVKSRLWEVDGWIDSGNACDADPYGNSEPTHPQVAWWDGRFVTAQTCSCVPDYGHKAIGISVYENHAWQKNKFVIPIYDQPGVGPSGSVDSLGLFIQGNQAFVSWSVWCGHETNTCLIDMAVVSLVGGNVTRAIVAEGPNIINAEHQSNTSIAADPAGNFVVTWPAYGKQLTAWYRTFHGSNPGTFDPPVNTGADTPYAAASYSAGTGSFWIGFSLTGGPVFQSFSLMPTPTPTVKPTAVEPKPTPTPNGNSGGGHGGGCALFKNRQNGTFNARSDSPVGSHAGMDFFGICLGCVLWQGIKKARRR